MPKGGRRGGRGAHRRKLEKQRGRSVPRERVPRKREKRPARVAEERRPREFPVYPITPKVKAKPIKRIHYPVEVRVKVFKSLAKRVKNLQSFEETKEIERAIETARKKGAIGDLIASKLMVPISGYRKPFEESLDKGVEQANSIRKFREVEAEIKYASNMSAISEAIANRLSKRLAERRKKHEKALVERDRRVQEFKRGRRH